MSREYITTNSTRTVKSWKAKRRSFSQPVKLGVSQKMWINFENQMNIKGENEKLLIYNKELSNWYPPHMHPKTNLKVKSLKKWGVFSVRRGETRTRKLNQWLKRPLLKGISIEWMWIQRQIKGLMVYIVSTLYAPELHREWIYERLFPKNKAAIDS